MTKITEQVEWYYKNSEKATIELLLDFQDRLSWNYYFYCSEYQNEMLDYAEKYWTYKTQYAKLYLENIAKKITEEMTSAKATELAKSETMAEWSAQMFASAHIESMKLQMRAIEKILSSCTQRISHLKLEKQLTPKQV